MLETDVDYIVKLLGYRDNRDNKVISLKLYLDEATNDKEILAAILDKNPEIVTIIKRLQEIGDQLQALYTERSDLESNLREHVKKTFILHTLEKQ